MRDEWHYKVKKQGGDLDKEIQEQKDKALLRMTERKVETEQKLKEANAVIEVKDSYIRMLENLLLRSG